MTIESSAHSWRLLIDGRLEPGAGVMAVINPATTEPLAMCPRADLAQLNIAVFAAKGAFTAWASTPIDKRKRALFALADALSDRTQQFAMILTEEQGKPLGDAQAEVTECVNMLRSFANMELSPQVIRDTAHEYIVQESAPLGVVAVITAWNFPLYLLTVKIAPALLAGNTVDVKPAPTTPLTTLLFGELCTGLLPDGVFNVITDQNDLGEALTRHPDIAKITFTGSSHTGRKVMAQAAETLKRLTLELGGNDAAIILEDANIEEVSAKVFAGAMINAGQLCTAIKRVYVPDPLYNAMCEKLALLANQVIIGDGKDASTQMGPLQNQAHFGKVRSLLADAHREGTVIAGGQALDRAGYFIRPTIVRDIRDDARLVQEEQFGPILPIMRYRRVEEAIERANDSIYGLSGTVWGHDAARALAVARRLECGTVWVNRHLDLPVDVAFGGVKQSGLGVELGKEGLLEFAQRRIVSLGR
jgi:acyl-CoA reductase-like NAD-dependent aldehyde dehydrogenase